MKKLLLILMMPVMLSRLSGQEEDLRAFSFVNTGTPSFSSYSESGTMEYVQRIYSRLTQAPGNKNMPVPRLEISKVKHRAAYVSYSKTLIVIEEEAIQACRRFGDAAVAFLLGHELTHYYEKHAWSEVLIGSNPDLGVGTELRKVSLRNKIMWETQADYSGGFRAYLAGYGFFHRGDELLDEIYRVYGLPDSIKGYPTLSERKELTRSSTKRIEKLVDALEMANLLTVTGSFKEANAFYDYVLKEYQSPEVLNNRGVAMVLDVLHNFPENHLKYVLPIQIQMGNRPVHFNTRNALDAIPGQQQLLQAIEYFDQAINLDKNYAPAFLNKACVYALLRDSRRARFIADVEAREKAGNNAKTLADIEVLLAIIDASNGEYDSARGKLQAEAAKGSRLAEANLSILNNEESPSSRQQPVFEKIDYQFISEVLNNTRLVAEDCQKITEDYRFYHDPEHGPNSMLMICENVRSGHTILFHFTHRSYKGTSMKGISIGSMESAVIQAYGVPDRTLETPTGRILRYGSLLFVIDAHGKVERWANYAVQMN